MLPYFKKSENQQHGASQFHGVDKLLNVADAVALSLVSQHFVEAAVATGYDRNPDFNGATQDGWRGNLSAYFQRRQTAKYGCCVPASNLTTTTNALVTRLLFEGTRAIGVEYLHNGTLHQAFVNQEVILSAGAFDSPKLLMLSGIGNAQDLRALGISPVVDLPGVSQNLQEDHLSVSVAYLATQDIQPALTSNIAEAGLFLHTTY